MHCQSLIIKKLQKIKFSFDVTKYKLLEESLTSPSDSLSGTYFITTLKLIYQV